MLSTDLLFVHPPAYFDFRDEDEVYFPFMSTTGDVPITPLYEYFPLGFLSLKAFLEANEISVEILNLSTLMLKFPEIDIERYFAQTSTRVFGIDLHWMVHVQGALAVSRLLKKIYPDIPVMLGGISSTYFASELIQLECIDFVMRGYDTHVPVLELMKAVIRNKPLDSVPNLCWKERNGAIHQNAFSHKPGLLSKYNQWGETKKAKTSSSMPILEMLSVFNAGCAFDCGWCGGSKSSFSYINQCEHTVVHRPIEGIETELSSIKHLRDRGQYSLYTCGSYNLAGNFSERISDCVASLGLKSIYYEQYHLTEEYLLKKMAEANPKTVITLSPESHDRRIGKLSGRGVYSMAQMETWIEKALDLGIHRIEIWFFNGLPEQDTQSLMDTVNYCGGLLKKFQGKNVNAYICPMIPFLDPGSRFFREPEQNGYRVHCKTVRDHEESMRRSSLINRLNYETRWMSRKQIVLNGYEAMRRLFEFKGRYGMLPMSMITEVNKKLRDAVDFIKIIHEIDSIFPEIDRRKKLDELSTEIRNRNRDVFFSGVYSQSYPSNRHIGERWFDAIPFAPSRILQKLGAMS